MTSSSSNVQEMLGLRARPIALAFLDQAPAGVAAWSGPAQPAGCAFWLKAQQGESFYTVPSDHFNCAVGAYTHTIDLPQERAEELGATIGLMVENGYLEMSEVPGIPRLERSPAAVAYGPADSAGFEPDAIVVTANAAQTMLIYEAALRIGAAEALTKLLGRPSCAVLPLTLKNRQVSVSLGCAGNRLYTELPEDEMYIAIPGDRWDELKTKLAEIVGANARMGEYYRKHQEEVQNSA